MHLRLSIADFDLFRTPGWLEVDSIDEVRMTHPINQFCAEKHQLCGMAYKWRRIDVKNRAKGCQITLPGGILPRSVAHFTAHQFSQTGPFSTAER
jgi:hypothetical protein